MGHVGEEFWSDLIRRYTVRHMDSNCIKLAYGYAVFEATIKKASKGTKDEDEWMEVSYRSEGESLPQGARHTKSLLASDARELALQVLATGRTVECGPGVNLRSVGFDVPRSGVSEDWTFLRECVMGLRLGRPPLNLQPDYQRGAVWTKEQQSLFLGHALLGGVVQPIYIDRDTGSDHAEEVIDGQQRIRAAIAFLEGHVAAVGWDGDKFVSFRYADMNEVDRRSHRLSFNVVYLNLARRNKLRLYLLLNSAGTPHTEEELNKVRRLMEER